MRKIALALLVAALFQPVCSPAALGAGKVLNVQLQFRPTEPLVTSGQVKSPGTLALGPITDGRIIQDRTQVGENREHRDPVPVLTRDTVESFTAKVLTHCFTTWGVSIDENAPIVLSVDVTRFFVTETNTYIGEVSYRMKLSDRSGNTLFDTTVTGTNRRFGRSLSRDNYNEVLSDSAISAIGNLGNQREFWSAAAGQPLQDRRSPQTISPEDLKREVLSLLEGQFSNEMILSFVRQHRLSRPLSAQELADWKATGISDEVIGAVLRANSAGE